MNSQVGTKCDRCGNERRVGSGFKLVLGGHTLCGYCFRDFDITVRSFVESNQEMVPISRIDDILRVADRCSSEDIPVSEASSMCLATRAFFCRGCHDRGDRWIRARKEFGSGHDSLWGDCEKCIKLKEDAKVDTSEVKVGDMEIMAALADAKERQCHTDS